MPELAEAALVWAAEAIGGDAVGAAIASSAAVTYLPYVASISFVREQQRKTENRARDAYNNSLRDRYAMVRGAIEPRKLVLGRQRVSGPIGFIRSYGTNQTGIVYTVILAAHEIDAIETIYFDDEPVVLDGSGNVIGISRREDFSISAATATVSITTTPQSGSVSAVAYYGTTAVALTVTSVTGTSVSVSGANSSSTGLLRVTYQPSPCPFVPQVTGSFIEIFAVTSSTQTFTTARPAAGVNATQVNGSGDTYSETAVGVSSVSGTSVTLYGLTGGQVTISYQAGGPVSRARVRKYLGAAGQAADSSMVSNLPGVWTSAHVGVGLAYLVVELDYDANSFPSGIPVVSAVVRGLKCFDPRSSTTAWTENPALLMRAYATNSLGGRLAAAQIDDTTINAAANVCDTSTNYPVNGQTYTRAQYTAGHAVASGLKPADVLNELAQAMGGKWWMADGVLKVKAGSYTSPVMALTDAWLHQGNPVQVQPGPARADTVNAVTGTFIDSERDFKILAFPKFINSTYVTDDSLELPLDIQMAAVTFTGQAQYISACHIRRSRNGLVLKASCNQSAYQCEPGDNITVTLPRFGWVSKVFEVLDTAYSLDGGIDLILQESDPSIWALDTAYTALQPNAATRLPSPWTIPGVVGLATVSDATTAQRNPDGSKQARIKVTWTPNTDTRLTSTGQVEIRWGRTADDETKWHSELVPGSASTWYLSPVQFGSGYLVKARTISDLAVSDWTAHVAQPVITAATFEGIVGTAQLAPLAVTNPKIGNFAVDTLQLNASAVTTVKVTDLNITTTKIADNAVLIPITATNNTSYTGSSGVTYDIFDLSFSAPQPSKIIILWHGEQGTASGSTFVVNIYINGTLSGTTRGGSGVAQDAPNCFAFATVSAGTITVRVDWQGSTGQTMTSQSMIVLVAQK